MSNENAPGNVFDVDGLLPGPDLTPYEKGIWQALRVMTDAYAQERDELRRRNAVLASWVGVVRDTGLAAFLDEYATWLEECADDVSLDAGTTPPGDPVALRAWAELLRSAPGAETAG